MLQLNLYCRSFVTDYKHLLVTVFLLENEPALCNWHFYLVDTFRQVNGCELIDMLNCQVECLVHAVF